MESVYHIGRYKCVTNEKVEKIFLKNNALDFRFGNSKPYLC